MLGKGGVGFLDLRGTNVHTVVMEHTIVTMPSVVSGKRVTLLVGAVMVRFFPDTRLLRIRLKLCLKDFFKDLTLERGPSIARESFGCKVHLNDNRRTKSKNNKATKYFVSTQ